MPRALLLTGDAAEELDTMYPYYRVQEGGWDVDVSSRTMRDVQLVIHEFDPNSDAYVEKNGRKLPVDVPWADVDVERYDALIIPGGRAPEWIRVDPDVRRITEHFFARNLP
ncbi:DJ-1/PfpI family protein, partial [Microbispora sp. ATCC PTA-5024]|uniref:DJ-1/PfpI family protein n=1 Tax=Microbispora sp. ATCC PTA-5024 TaxID=316330 RepID=UPI0003DD8F98